MNEQRKGRMGLIIPQLEVAKLNNHFTQSILDKYLGSRRGYSHHQHLPIFPPTNRNSAPGILNINSEQTMYYLQNALFVRMKGSI